MTFNVVLWSHIQRGTDKTSGGHGMSIWWRKKWTNERKVEKEKRREKGKGKEKKTWIPFASPLTSGLVNSHWILRVRPVPPWCQCPQWLDSSYATVCMWGAPFLFCLSQGKGPFVIKRAVFVFLISNFHRFCGNLSPTHSSVVCVCSHLLHKISLSIKDIIMNHAWYL